MQRRRDLDNTSKPSKVNNPTLRGQHQQMLDQPAHHGTYVRVSKSRASPGLWAACLPPGCGELVVDRDICQYVYSCEPFD